MLQKASLWNNREIKKTNQARIFAPDRVFESNLLEDGDKFNIDKLEFTIILTQAHSGHTYLYLERKVFISLVIIYF